MGNAWRKAKKASITLAMFATVAVGFVGCGGGSSGSISIVGGGGGIYTQAWYDVYGTHCGDATPRPGCNFYADGTKVRDYQDPYYTSYRNVQWGIWAYTDSYGYRSSYSGYAWLSNDGVLYADTGRALNNTDGDSNDRDLIGEAAAQEQEVVQTVGKEFASKYALSEDTGVRIASTLNDWATLGKSRARTDADLAEFSQRLYGISVDKAKNAVMSAVKGDLSGLEAANVEVATSWGTTPETSKEILKSWYKSELDSAGIK